MCNCFTAETQKELTISMMHLMDFMDAHLESLDYIDFRLLQKYYVKRKASLLQSHGEKAFIQKACDYIGKDRHYYVDNRLAYPL